MIRKSPAACRVHGRRSGPRSSSVHPDVAAGDRRKVNHEGYSRIGPGSSRAVPGSLGRARTAFAASSWQILPLDPPDKKPPPGAPRRAACGVTRVLSARLTRSNRDIAPLAVAGAVSLPRTRCGSAVTRRDFPPLAGCSVINLQPLASQIRAGNTPANCKVPALTANAALEPKKARRRK